MGEAPSQITLSKLIFRANMPSKGVEAGMLRMGMARLENLTGTASKLPQNNFH